jgi:hypothetical protein
MSGSARRYLEMFKCLCGEQNLKNVVLLTTMWSELHNPATGLQRERELRKEFWMDMEKCGSTVRRYEGSKAEAEAIICRMVRERDIVLDIQTELVDQEKRLEDTLVGQWIAPMIERSIGESEQRIHKLQLLIEDAELGKDKSVIDLKEEREKLLAQQQENLGNRNRLKKRTGCEVTERIEAEKKEGRWKSRLTLFGSLLGLVITATVNVILPLAGVSVFL